MFDRHRDFLYKRSQNGAHRNLAARAPPVKAAEIPIPDAATPPAAGAQTSSVGPLVPVSTKDDTPSSTPSPNTPPLQTSVSPAATLSPSASSVQSSSRPSSSSSSSSTSAHTTPSALSTPSTVAFQPSLYPSLSSTLVVPGATLTSSPQGPSASSTGSSSSGGTNTGVIVGGIAGTLVGVAVLGFLLMWCMRRQRDRDIDDFDAQAFKRQSAILVDDPVEPLRSYNPRPPTMIERHNASPALGSQPAYGEQNFYGSYGGYNQQSPYPPHEMIQPTGSPPPQAYGAPPMGYAGYNEPQQRIVRQPSNAAYDTQQQLARQPSNAAYLTRQPSSLAGYAPPPAPPGPPDSNPQYIDLNRSSVSPYQAAQYADISRQLGSTDPNGQVHQPVELPEGPLPSPFDDPVEPNPSRQFNHPAAASSATALRNQGNVAERPATVYDEGDAYGGI